MLSKKIFTVATIASVLTLGIAREASAWIAIEYAPGKYAIVCKSGHAWTYNGGEEGLSIVVPSLCGANGVVSATPVGGGKLGAATTTRPSKVFLGDEAGVENRLPEKTTVGKTDKVLTRMNFVLPKGVTRGVSANVDLATLKNWKESGAPGVQSKTVPSYPPDGYPCLGCHPCEGNTTEFCDDKTNSRVVVGLPVGWTPVITNSTKEK
jgi:hypothetical protein